MFAFFVLNNKVRHNNNVVIQIVLPTLQQPKLNNRQSSISPYKAHVNL